MFGLICVVLILFALSKGWGIVPILCFGFLIILSSTIDGVIHTAVPFILAKTKAVNLIRFRVTLMLLMRGANVITPTLALLLIGNLNLALAILAGGSLISFVASLILTYVSRDEPTQKKPPAKIGQMNLVVFYTILLFALNAIFGHVTSIMLAVHALGADQIAYQNAAFFVGFMAMSLLLIVKPKILSALMDNTPAVLAGIIASLLMLSASFGLSFFLDGMAKIVPILGAGLTYGINLHLVTTILPSFLNIDKIYKDLNYGKIGATCGALISGIWVASLSTTNAGFENGFIALSLGSLGLAFLLGLYWLHIHQKSV